MTIEELFGTLQQSVVGAWRKHLRTSKYAKHMALDELYTEMPEKVDDLIEAWMGVNGRKPKQFDNLLKSKNMNTLDYLKSLKRVVKDGYELMNGENELEALLDDIAELIDSTLYKVKELNENKTKKHMKNLKEFLNESLIQESLNKNEINLIIKNLKLKKSPTTIENLEDVIEMLEGLIDEKIDIDRFYINDRAWEVAKRSIGEKAAKELTIDGRPGNILAYETESGVIYNYEEGNGWVEF